MPCGLQIFKLPLMSLPYSPPPRRYNLFWENSFLSLGHEFHKGWDSVLYSHSQPSLQAKQLLCSGRSLGNSFPTHCKVEDLHNRCSTGMGVHSICGFVFCGFQRPVANHGLKALNGEISDFSMARCSERRGWNCRLPHSFLCSTSSWQALDLQATCTTTLALDTLWSPTTQHRMLWCRGRLPGGQPKQFRRLGF